MLTLEIFFSASKAEEGGKKNKKRRFYLAVSRLDINAILSMLALRSLDPLCSTDTLIYTCLVNDKKKLG